MTPARSTGASPGTNEAPTPRATSLDHYRLLGRSGLRVSPLALGTMTFGTDWGWGADSEQSRRIFDRYVELGGNFIDTANMYTNGTSERTIGEFASGRRDHLVIATKYTLTSDPNDPNAGGNHRKSMMRSVEGSLGRLGTDYIDLLYLHLWDFTTPVEEILRGMDDLVRSGKVLYLGISDTPAWQISRMQTLTELRGWSPLIALQIEYNLIERTVERDLIPMTTEMGLGVVPWAPLRRGVLAGKYDREDLNTDTAAPSDGTRRAEVHSRGLVTERSLEIVEVVKGVARELDRSPSQVSLAWLLTRGPVVSPIVGVRTLTQLEDNLGALAVEFSREQLARLDDASAVELGFPHEMLVPRMFRRLIGEVEIATPTALRR
jgi:aryl-alcohol dehydrogenase-like predicted oxidoreductase